MRPTHGAIGAVAVAASLGLAGCGADAQNTASDSDYSDGEYTATGWYGSLPSHHDVTLTITDDIVTAVEITTPAEDETSLGYQRRFAAALPEAVIGRNVDDLDLDLDVDRLAGSSGCSEGFMDALDKIKNEATEGSS